MKKVVINGKEWKLAYNLRSLFIYEEAAGHPYKGEKTIDTYLLFWAMLSANNEGFSMEFEELVDAWKRVAAFVDNKKKAMTQ